ncbi:hypothetical protein EIP73_02195 [Xylella fastidiosa subsp. pauca]|nr:hypothetical protein EIP73_02195 [Xylella fastidiosa subsp. pauca]
MLQVTDPNKITFRTKYTETGKKISQRRTDWRITQHLNPRK